MPTHSRIEKVYTKVSLREQRSDFAYWQTRPYEERIAALEEIRREFHQWEPGAEPRIQKVCTIIKRQPLPENQPQELENRPEPE